MSSNVIMGPPQTVTDLNNLLNSKVGRKRLTSLRDSEDETPNDQEKNNKQ